MSSIAFWCTTAFVGVALFTDAAPSVNAYARVNAISGMTLTLSSLDQSYDSFDNGDRVIIMQMQDNVIGNTSNTSSFGGLNAIESAGLFEVNWIASIGMVSGTPGTITLQNPLTIDFHTCTNCRVQIITYPQLGTPDFTTSSDLEPIAWDGEKGGVLAFEVAGKLILNHNISASGRGFRGGVKSVNWGGPGCDINTYASSSTNYATKGESIHGNLDPTISKGRGKSLNGGGGGSSHNGGGGGGGNYSAGGAGGQGWSSSGCLPGVGGLGGIALSGYISPNRLFLGGGGGGGQQNNSVGSNGGNGGGIILIRAQELEAGGNVKIASDGLNTSNAGNDGAGGAGAGGSILLDIPVITAFPSRTLQITASGGDGGNVTNSGLHAGGGGGGQGTIVFTGAVPTSNVTALTAPGEGGCNINNCSSTAENGIGPNNMGVLSGMPSLLDLKWISFAAVSEQGMVKIHWIIQADVPAMQYTVQTSRDLALWESNQNVNPNEETGVATTYTTRLTPKSFSAITYYRILRVDITGEESFSPIAAYSPDVKPGLIQLPYPNPSRDYIYIDTFGETVNVLLLDETGRKLDENIVTGQWVLHRRNLAAGVYFIECLALDRRELYRVVFEE